MLVQATMHLSICLKFECTGSFLKCLKVYSIILLTPLMKYMHIFIVIDQV
jgi:hypothetical protein